MLVERNENQKVELKERERIGVRGKRGETQREQQESEEIDQRRQIRIPDKEDK